VEEEYQNPLTLITKDQKMEFTCTVKAMKALFVALLEFELVKVMDFSTTKLIRVNMSSCYEGGSKVKKYKIQGFRIQFKSLKMHDAEDI